MIPSAFFLWECFACRGSRVGAEYFSVSETDVWSSIYIFLIKRLPHSLQMQGFYRALLDAVHAQNTLRTMEPPAGIVQHIDLHGANLPALAAANAFFFIMFNPQQRKIACGL